MEDSKKRGVLVRRPNAERKEAFREAETQIGGYQWRTYTRVVMTIQVP